MSRALCLTLMSFAILVLAASPAAAIVNVVGPYNITMHDGGSFFIGKVGPGQTFSVTISAATRDSTGYNLTMGWNRLVASGMPAGWIAQNSSLYNQYPSVAVTVAPDAKDGNYIFNLTAVNVGNYSKIGSVTFNAYVYVTPDVFKLDVSPASISAGVGQPARIYVTINNTGVSDSPFVISMNGLPAWDSKYQVIALHHTSQNFVYEVYGSEPGVYPTTLQVSSQSSPRIFRQSNITLTVQASVLNDYAAIGGGTIAFPIIYEPVYAIMHLIGMLFTR